MTRLGSVRQALLCGVSAIAIQFAIDVPKPARAQGLPPGISLSLEGGLACTVGDEGRFTAIHENKYSGAVSASSRFGGDECGGTGRIGIFQGRPGAFLGMADYWGIFVRHSDFGKDKFSAQATNNVSKYFHEQTSVTYNLGYQGRFQEERTIVDFEIGRDIGIGISGNRARLLAGLRYARYENDISVNGSFASFVGPDQIESGLFSLKTTNDFDGFGPRLGFMDRQRLGQRVDLVFSGSGSALWGRQKIHVNSMGVGEVSGLGEREITSRFTSSDHDWIFNLEGEVGLSFAVFQRGELVAGVRGEAWFNQAQPARLDFTSSIQGDLTLSDFSLTGEARSGGELDRFNWGPFVRLNIPLGPPPPP